MGVLILSVCLSFVVANYLGSKRQIGYGWSLFFCLTLTIVGGLIVTLLSRKYQPDNTTPPSRVKIVIGWILIKKERSRAGRMICPLFVTLVIDES